MTNERERALEAARRILRPQTISETLKYDAHTDATLVARALLSAPGWQTIDSAPRDRDVLLLARARPARLSQPARGDPAK